MCIHNDLVIKEALEKTNYVIYILHEVLIHLYSTILFKFLTSKKILLNTNFYTIKEFLEMYFIEMIENLLHSKMLNCLHK